MGWKVTEGVLAVAKEMVVGLEKEAESEMEHLTRQPVTRSHHHLVYLGVHVRRSVLEGSVSGIYPGIAVW